MPFRNWARRVPFAQWNGEERVPLSNFHGFFLIHFACLPLQSTPNIFMASMHIK